MMPKRGHGGRALLLTAALLVLAVSTACGAVFNSDEADKDDETDHILATASECRPHTVIPNIAGRFSGSGLDLPVCQVDAQGRVLFEYEVTACDDQAFRGCVFALHQDLTRFDPAGSGQGMYRAKVCVEGQLEGSVNLYYEQVDYDGAGPEGAARRRLPIINDADTALTGCRTLTLASRDVDGPLFCPLRATESKQCLEPDEPEQHAPDVWADATFDDAQWVITSEWCDKNRTEVGATVSVSVEALTYYPKECLCDTDMSCDAGSICRRDLWPSGACCECDPEGCPGVCSP